jgi:alanyl-tRNA synthetase
MRVIADHLRAMTFLIGDGVLPSNEWRGYVLRKIMRRAMRHGKKLGYTQPILHTFVDVVVTEMGDAYPELVSGREAIRRTVKAEEERFDAVLTSGLPRLEDLIERTIQAGRKVIDGGDVFRLYDSLGVPLDFAEDMAAQRGLSIDRAAYDASLESQRERARAGSKFGSETDATASAKVDRKGDDQFVGYDRTTEQAVVVGVHELNEPGADAADALVWLDRTPFYVEAGGQVSDTGEITGANGVRATVTGVRKAPSGHMRAHVVKFASGRLKEGDRVTASVDAARRDATRRNHTATHLLHAALRQRLGARPAAIRLYARCGPRPRRTSRHRARRQRTGVSQHGGRYRREED